MVSDDSPPAPAAEPATEAEAGRADPARGRLRRELGVMEAAALSISIMAPTAAMALNGSLSASYAGPATALAFLLAFVTIILVSYAFVQFAKTYATAGSVYRFNGTALGARIGFLSGWTLLFTYVTFTVASAAEVGLFFQTFMSTLGYSLPWVIPALISVAVILFFGIRRIQLSTRVTLTVECISVSVIIALIGYIVARGGAHGFSVKPFSPAHVGLSDIALASVFAFLGFAGFEGAAVLGEETRSPMVSIPRAITVAVISVGVFSVGVIYVQAEGFGLSPAGVHAFASSSGPLSQLSQMYVGKPMAAAIAAGATISAFAAALGTATGSTRLLFTLGRDRLLPASFGRTTKDAGSPLAAMLAVVIITTACVLAMAAAGISAVSSFGDFGSLGVLALLVVYLVTEIAAIRLFSGRWRPVQFAIPVVAIILLGYALYGNVYPVPPLPARIFPYIVLGWIVIGVVVSLLFPQRLRQVAAHLAQEAP
jgi:amino acid transporter